MLTTDLLGTKVQFNPGLESLNSKAYAGMNLTVRAVYVSPISRSALRIVVISDDTGRVFDRDIECFVMAGKSVLGT